ncbi:pyridoxamine 5'-phosphate oxidase family protein [Nocardioides zeae]|uniref:Pyridoxamine 5'-phosphate oxidase family protein n=1 Tax=Nocardioides zeae TaxID=1457234 RepID=A0A6P0HIQ7_9ACTN|nr:pyridoxamine 5'-phosphate oxidase family protein [Nocardioides zeae]NEN78592.1 pyridoxamine 5'-phosphate oxidase family protein [Nocardioides zeae]
MSHHDTDGGTAKVAELVEQARIAMLTTMTSDGKHVSRPMALQEVEFDGDLWFFCHDDSAKVAEVREHPQVNVSFADPKHAAWTSLSGTALLTHDADKARELWSPALEVWFPDGLETPTLALLKVDVATAEYWESSSSRVRRLVGGIRAAVTGDPGKFPAENETTVLEDR